MAETYALTERQKKILRIVVQEYVDTAQPVGSRTIAEKYHLGVSPATVRNELAALERLGLLAQPHTSAGRVPTDTGYRYYVAHLLETPELSPAEKQAIRRRFEASRQEIDQWLRITTTVLAEISRAAALATLPQARRSHFKHVELVAIRDAVVLMVLVLEAGTVKQQILTLDRPLEQTELSRISNELNEHLAQADAEAVRARTGPLSALAQQVALLAAEIMEREDSHLSDRIYRYGLAQVLETPEFAEGESARRIVQVLEQRPLLEEILGSLITVQDVQVLIAGDGRFVQLQDLSLVLGRYGVGNKVTGLLGVIGPTRMPYGRTIGAVRFVSALMSDLMGQLYGFPSNRPLP